MCCVIWNYCIVAYSFLTVKLLWQTVLFSKSYGKKIFLNTNRLAKCQDSYFIGAEITSHLLHFVETQYPTGDTAKLNCCNMICF